MGEYIILKPEVVQNNNHCTYCGANLADKHGCVAIVGEYVICRHCGTVVGKTDKEVDNEQGRETEI